MEQVINSMRLERIKLHFKLDIQLEEVSQNEAVNYCCDSELTDSKLNLELSKLLMKM